VGATDTARNASAVKFHSDTRAENTERSEVNAEKKGRRSRTRREHVRDTAAQSEAVTDVSKDTATANQSEKGKNITLTEGGEAITAATSVTDDAAARVENTGRSEIDVKKRRRSETRRESERDAAGRSEAATDVSKGTASPTKGAKNATLKEGGEASSAATNVTNDVAARAGNTERSEVNAKKRTSKARRERERDTAAHSEATHHTGKDTAMTSEERMSNGVASTGGRGEGDAATGVTKDTAASTSSPHKSGVKKREKPSHATEAGAGAVSQDGRSHARVKRQHGRRKEAQNDTQAETQAETQGETRGGRQKGTHAGRQSEAYAKTNAHTDVDAQSAPQTNARTDVNARWARQTAQSHNQLAMRDTAPRSPVSQYDSRREHSERRDDGRPTKRRRTLANLFKPFRKGKKMLSKAFSTRPSRRDQWLSPRRTVDRSVLDQSVGNAMIKAHLVEEPNYTRRDLLIKPDKDDDSRIQHQSLYEYHGGTVGDAISALPDEGFRSMAIAGLNMMVDEGGGGDGGGVHLGASSR